MAWIAAALATLLAAGAILLTYRVVAPPDNASVVTDDERGTFASTPCVLANHIERELIANRSEVADPAKPLQLLGYANERTFGEVRSNARWTRDAQCNYVTGFDQIVTLWMRMVGYRSRWSDDGQWRW